MKKDIIDRVYKEYYRDVYLYIYSLCKNHHETEILVSDTFFKAILSLDGSEVHLKYWLLRVGKNLWLDSLKKKPQSSIEDDYIDQGKGPLEQLILNETQRTVYESIVRLSNSYKEILVYYYFNGFSLKEIAEMKKISPGAARTLLYRARINLKAKLKEEGIDEF
ncbi:RNA polymerase sigma factor [Fusibacter ferrireducens]|uniref:RNA polymerase sigma factor n=1 Tax=Fusibacter ferrireducens TaxID=2785058 RepID=A0ABR9ZXY6_9FIRM|nr:RNA polymerase sigma factor [Fusibacter ferrireducens]MBF4694740.1 RNA polymerase sigma factor [Fusibacter ferrireducens]